MGEALILAVGLDLDDDVLSCGVDSFENSARLGTEQRLSGLLALAINKAEKESRVLVVNIVSGPERVHHDLHSKVFILEIVFDEGWTKRGILPFLDL